MSGPESRSVDVVRVRNALITHSFVASKNVAVSEDNASLHGRFESFGAGSIEVTKESSHASSKGQTKLGSLLKRRSTGQQDPVNPFLRQVLQALMHVLRPTELCRLLSALETATTLSKKNAGALESASSSPNVLDASLLGAKGGEYFVAVISNRLSGVEEDALFILHASKVEKGQESKGTRIQRRLSSLRKTKSLERFSSRKSLSRSSRSSKGQVETEENKSSQQEKVRQTFVTDSLAKAPAVPVELSIVKILPIWSDLRISLKGRGLIRLTSSGESLRIGTVSVISMWRLVTSLNRAMAIAKANNLFPQGPSHKWVTAYNEPRSSVVQKQSDDKTKERTSKRREADKPVLDDLDGVVPLEPTDEDTDDGSSSDTTSRTSYSNDTGTSTSFSSASNETSRLSASSRVKAERAIVEEIRTIIQNTLNLDDLTTQDVIRALEKKLGKSLMSQFKKSFIDEKIIQIYGQQDPPSLIENWLYLGTEYNASNYSELQQLGITDIINVTKEIKNFFPDVLDYYRISVKDRESADLYTHLEPVCKAMLQLEIEGKRVLVHCQRGISRSATVVVAYLMFRDGLSLHEATKVVKARRSIIKPNKGFVRQLEKFDKYLYGSKEPSP